MMIIKRHVARKIFFKFAVAQNNPLPILSLVGGGYFYFKIYKPKKEAQIADEDMEYVDEGVPLNEDEVSENGEVNADTPIDELAFDEEEAYTYDEE